VLSIFQLLTGTAAKKVPLPLATNTTTFRVIVQGIVNDVILALSRDCAGNHPLLLFFRNLCHSCLALLVLAFLNRALLDSRNLQAYDAFLLMCKSTEIRIKE